MSDYLTHLAQRSVGIADGVRPRATGPFEPRNDAFELMLEREAAPPPPTARRPAEPRSPAAVEARRDHDTPGPAAETPPAVEPAQAEETAPPRRAAETRRAPPERPERRPPPLREAAAAPAPEPIHVEAAVPRAEGSRTPAPGPAAPPTARRPAEPLTARRAAPAPRTESSSGLPGREEPPVVRVTIGRVDVRAVLPQPEPERTPRKEPPRLSLEEYLGRGARR